MPALSTRLHLDMLNDFKSRRRANLLQRILKSLRQEIASSPLYGLEWGDPDQVEPLTFVRDRYILPYVRPEHSAVEIGPGGGRWTRYLLGFGKLYEVDYYSEMLDELRSHFNQPNIVFIKNNGTDFPGIVEHSIDFVFSFGTFVHLDAPLIQDYLAQMKSILKPRANVVLQYSDKTKIMAQLNAAFSDTTPDAMRRLVLDEGYKIVEEDLTTMWHSSIVRFTP